MDIAFLKSFPTDERKEYQLPLVCESFWSHTFAFVQSAFLPPIVLTGHCQDSEGYPVSTLEIGSAVGVCRSILWKPKALLHDILHIAVCCSAAHAMLCYAMLSVNAFHALLFAACVMWTEKSCSPNWWWLSSSYMLQFQGCGAVYAASHCYGSLKNNRALPGNTSKNVSLDNCLFTVCSLGSADPAE